MFCIMERVSSLPHPVRAHVCLLSVRQPSHFVAKKLDFVNFWTTTDKVSIDIV
jgi:hypothetical protein